MSEHIQLDGKASICLTLPTLAGKIIGRGPDSLMVIPVEKLLNLTSGDPRQSGEKEIRSLAALARIHQSIEEVLGLKREGAEPSIETLCDTFTLTSIFTLYFRQYDLSHETWSCQLAWMHILRLRYHATIRLFERQDEPGIKDQKDRLMPHLRRARRDWTDFCTNADNYFLFSIETQEKAGGQWPHPVTDVEKEVTAIICPSPCKQPYKYYLTDEGRSRVLDGLIANWFLSNRYDWWGACRLARHSCRQKRRSLIAGFAFVFSVATSLMALYSQEGMTILGWILSIILALVYPLLAALLFWGIRWRTVMDLLLPRVWAGVMVGYLPLFITCEVWQIAYDDFWCLRKPLGLLVLNVIGGVLAFSYLRWEVGNRLARTPNLLDRVAMRRAAWLTIYGWLVSVISGLVIFSIAGKSMARACVANQGWLTEVGTSVLFSNIHLSALFLFAPFALLIGVVVQLFWEEKPITHHA